MKIMHLFTISWMLLGWASLSAQGLDSLRRVANTAPTPETQVAAWQELSFQSLYVQPDSTPVLARRSLVLARAAGLDSLMAEAWLLLGFHGMATGQADSALVAFAEAGQLHQQAGRLGRYGAVLGNMASVYQRLDSNEAALDLSLQAMRQFEQSGDSIRRAVLQGNVANLYVKMYDLDRARAMIDVCRAFTRRHLDVPDLAGTYYTATVILGNVLHSQGRFDSALHYLRLGLAGAEQVRDPYSRMGGANNLAATFEQRGQLDSAYLYYRQAYELAETYRVTDRKAIYAAHAATVLAKLGRVAAAQRYLQIVRDLQADLTEIDAREQWYKAESAYAEANGDLARALQFFRQASDLRDAILNAARVKALSELEVRYETEKKERQLAEAEEALARRQLLVVGLVGLSLILLLLGLLLWMRERARRRAAVIREQERGLRAVIEATEVERRRIARDLHDGVGQELGSLQLAFEQVQRQSLDPTLVQRLGERLRQLAQQLRGISHQMMPRALEVAGLAPALRELVETSFADTGYQARFDAFRVPKDLPADRALIGYRVAQELLSNVARHAQATEVDVQLSVRRGHLLLSVEDNGRGFLPQEASAAGLGLTSMRTRLRTVAGTLTYEPSEQGGTRALISIPLPA